MQSGGARGLELRTAGLTQPDPSGTVQFRAKPNPKSHFDCIYLNELIIYLRERERARERERERERASERERERASERESERERETEECCACM